MVQETNSSTNSTRPTSKLSKLPSVRFLTPNTRSSWEESLSNKMELFLFFMTLNHQQELSIWLNVESAVLISKVPLRTSFHKMPDFWSRTEKSDCAHQAAATASTQQHVPHAQPDLPWTPWQQPASDVVLYVLIALTLTQLCVPPAPV